MTEPIMATTLITIGGIWAFYVFFIWALFRVGGPA
jgi:hypothetical protein